MIFNFKRTNSLHEHKLSTVRFHRRTTVSSTEREDLLCRQCLLDSDHVTRWEGLPLTSAESALDTEDGPTIITETIKEEDEEKEDVPFQLKIIKVGVPNAVFPHVSFTVYCNRLHQKRIYV